MMRGKEMKNGMDVLSDAFEHSGSSKGERRIKGKITG